MHCQHEARLNGHTEREAMRWKSNERESFKFKCRLKITGIKKQLQHLYLVPPTLGMRGEVLPPHFQTDITVERFFLLQF